MLMSRIRIIGMYFFILKILISDAKILYFSVHLTSQKDLTIHYKTDIFIFGDSLNERIITLKYPMLKLNGIFPPLATSFDNDEKLATEKMINNFLKWNYYDLSGYLLLAPKR